MQLAPPAYLNGQPICGLRLTSNLLQGIGADFFGAGGFLSSLRSRSQSVKVRLGALRNLMLTAAGFRREARKFEVGRGTPLAASGAMRWSLAVLFVAGCGSGSPLKPDGGTVTAIEPPSDKSAQPFDVCLGATDCYTGYECYCGVCTKACATSNDCTAGATCPLLSPFMYNCAGTDQSHLDCVIQCSADADCKALGATALCTGGLCRRPTLVTSTDGGGTLTCAERTAQISAEVQATLGPVFDGADRSCKVDGDCVAVGIGNACYESGCGYVDVSMVGAATITAASKAFEDKDCPTFTKAGCVLPIGIYNCPVEGFPACVAGRCQDSIRGI